MIIFTEDGVYASFDSLDALDKISDATEKAIKEKGKVTITELYRDYLKIAMCYLEPDFNPKFEPDIYDVDPDLWGWDEKGYRQLYKVITVTVPLD